MAKKQGKKNSLATSPGLQNVTLREENVGRKHVNPHLSLKLQHLQRLATWAGGEASIPPLAAHFGRMLAAHAELERIPLDRLIVSCRRCETILQPGYNCTIRIENNASGAKHCRKSGILQNNVVYWCHFCSHRNLRRGTAKGHMKDLFALRPRPISGSNLADSMTTTIGKSDKDEMVANVLNGYNEHASGRPPFHVEGSPQEELTRQLPTEDGPKTPPTEVTEKIKITGSGSSKTAKTGPTYVTPGSGKDSSISSKRRRKGWSGLKEITLSSEREKEQLVKNLAIPFLM